MQVQVNRWYTAGTDRRQQAQSDDTWRHREGQGVQALHYILYMHYISSGFLRRLLHPSLPDWVVCGLDRLSEGNPYRTHSLCLWRQSVKVVSVTFGPKTTRCLRISMSTKFGDTGFGILWRIVRKDTLGVDRLYCDIISTFRKRGWIQPRGQLSQSRCKKLKIVLGKSYTKSSEKFMTYDDEIMRWLRLRFDGRSMTSRLFIRSH